MLEDYIYTGLAHNHLSYDKNGGIEFIFISVYNTVSCFETQGCGKDFSMRAVVRMCTYKFQPDTENMLGQLNRQINAFF